MSILNYYLYEIQRNNGYRPAIEVYVRKGDKLLFGLKKKFKVYVPPGGGIDDGETPIEAAKRETLEEIGVEIKNVKLLIKKPIYFKWNTVKGKLDITNERFVKYKGQSYQAVYALFDKINKSSFNIEGDGMRIKEFSIKEIKDMFKKGRSYNIPLYDFRLKMLDIISKKYF